jgi:peptide subunit release factor 1 (eRF1)
MITREIIRELADFQSSDGDAVTFYYQPNTPQDKSHRQEAIMVKDLVKEAMRKAERAGKNGPVRADLARVLDLAEKLRGNQGKTKAVFACASKDFWREFDLPTRDPMSTKLQMNSRFHLRPLSALAESLEKTCVCLVDRNKARMFEMEGDNIQEKEDLIGDMTRRVKSDGFEGFDAGHNERRFDNEASAHYKRVGERLLERYGYEKCDSILIGCRDEVWPAIERHFHPYVKQRLAGHFVIDPIASTPDEVRQHALKMLEQHRQNQRQNLLSEVLDEARANNNGALGLRRVLRAMEQGEVQSLLLGDGFQAEGVECGNCGHIDMRMVENCAVCGQKTHDIDDMADALIGRALRMRVNVVRIAASPEFEQAGNIGALLRFRAERSIGEALA